MNSPYETYNNEIGVRLSYLLEDDTLKRSDSLNLVKYSTIEKKYQRNPILRLRKGLGAGNEVLLNFKHLPDEWKGLLKSTFGDPKVAHNELEKYFEIDAQARLFFDGYTKSDGTHLKPEQISQWTINASVLKAFAALKQARETMHKRMGNSSRGLWPGLLADLQGFNEILKLKYNGIQHNLPLSERRLRPELKGLADEGYAYFVHGLIDTKNAAKVATPKQKAILEELLRKHSSFDNVQITKMYNEVAAKCDWKAIDDSTVANYRKQFGFYTHGGRFGETSFDNVRAMQNKRMAPSVATAYWTLDGWDAELLYQKREQTGNVTYHNRLTVVVVLDPVAGLKYPVGYAIGTHETPELITEALRNAANHTRELFGQRYKPLQLQSDHYALKTLAPVYEAMSQHYTPARVKNAKAKVIEPYFLRLNKMCQQYFPNWSGFGITSRKENQPNADYLNKIRHSFPDEQACRQQIERIIEMERSAKIVEYMERFEAMPEDDRLPLSNQEYLYLFGQTHSHTNRLQGQGLTPTINGQTFIFDSFDVRFRELAYLDWVVKYDPTDMSEVLVLDAKTDPYKKVKEIVGSHRFMLEQKQLQPMALYDRKEGDAKRLSDVSQYNKELKERVMDRMEETQKLVEEVFIENPQLNDTLSKLVLVDSKGQHKNNKSEARLKGASKKLPASKIKDAEVIETPEEDFIIINNVRNNY
jgi:hypothetical protein